MDAAADGAVPGRRGREGDALGVAAESGRVDVDGAVLETQRISVVASPGSDLETTAKNTRGASSGELVLANFREASFHGSGDGCRPKVRGVPGRS